MRGRGHLLRHHLFLESAHLPTLIIGDFNDWRNTLGKHHFAGHRFVQATAPARRFRSFPAFLALAALDKCFYRGDLHIHETRIVRTRLARFKAPRSMDFVDEVPRLPSGKLNRPALRASTGTTVSGTCRPTGRRACLVPA